MTYYHRIQIKEYDIALVGDEEGINTLFVESDTRCLVLAEDWIESAEQFHEAEKQLREYFDGSRDSFDLKLNPQGTVFQTAVWEQLQNIPYGELCSYKDVATAVGNPKASRAVGMANNKNPIPIIIPCHRVVGASGKLTGYAHGLDMKKSLIDMEQVHDSL